MKRINRNILIVILFIFICWLSVSIFISYNLTHRQKEKYTEQKPPDYLKNEFKKITLITEDSLKISGIMLIKSSSAPFVLLLHGNGDDFSSNYQLMDSLYHHDINSLAISFRCHGSSDGSLNDIGLSAKYDVIAAVNFIKSFSNDSRIIVAGRSLGAAAAIFAYEQIKKNAACFLLESPYYDLKNAVKYRLDYYLPRYISEIAYINLTIFSGLFLPELDLISPFCYSKKMINAQRIVFLAGDKDSKAPLKDIVQISKNIRGSKIRVFKGAQHQSLFFYDKKDYMDELLNLCKGF